MDINTTDKVQVGESTTGTSSSTTYRNTPPMEYGWVCPRCSRVNAPWKSQCDCSGNNWTVTWNSPEWWKNYITCQDTDVVNDKGTTAWSTINTIGGSDYWNSVTHNWENIPKTYTNQIDDTINKIDHVTTTTYYNTGDTK